MQTSFTHSDRHLPINTSTAPHAAIESRNMQHFLIIILSLFLLSSLSSPKSRLAAAGDNLSPSPPANDDGPAYHMGPVLASPIDLYIIWYGKWSNETHKSIIRDFIGSISSVLPRNANLLSSVSGWWKTATLYGDQTNQNVTGDISIAGEFSDQYSRSRNLSRLDMQYIVRNSAMSDKSKSRPSINGNNGMYLILTSDDVQVQDFCRAVCGFHYFTYAHVVGLTVPYAWVGNSGVQCPGFCAYPFALPPSGGMNNPPLKPPNGDVGIDGMISVIGHELAEVATNPLVNSWYGGDDPTAPHEIADLCVGVYGPGAGGGYIGQNVYRDRLGGSYNAIGVKGRKFLLQWLWNPSLEKCDGPNHNK